MRSRGTLGGMLSGSGFRVSHMLLRLLGSRGKRSFSPVCLDGGATWLCLYLQSTRALWVCQLQTFFGPAYEKKPVDSCKAAVRKAYKGPQVVLSRTPLCPRVSAQRYLFQCGSSGVVPGPSQEGLGHRESIYRKP